MSSRTKTSGGAVTGLVGRWIGHRRTSRERHNPQLPIVLAALIGVMAIVVPPALLGGASRASGVASYPATENVGVEPLGVAVDPANDTVYVANSGDNTVSVIDGATSAVTATIGVGSQPAGIAVEPRTHLLYVSNDGDNTVSVIDGLTHAVKATINVGSEPLGIATDPTTDTIYVANSGDNTVSVIDGASRRGDGYHRGG